MTRLAHKPEWLHPSSYAPDYHPDAVQQLRSTSWLSDHATAAWFGFAAGIVCVGVPCVVTLAWVLA